MYKMLMIPLTGPVLSDQTRATSEATTLGQEILPTPPDPSNLISLQDGDAHQSATSGLPAEVDHRNLSGESAPDKQTTLPSVNIDRIKEGTRTQPFTVRDNSPPMKEERRENLRPRVPTDPQEQVETKSLKVDNNQSPEKPTPSAAKSPPVVNGVQFRFISDSPGVPRERSFAQCNNVRKLFAHAKQAGLSRGESLMPPLLALQIPGLCEPVGICIGDDKDFETFAEILETARGSTHEDQGDLVVEVRADRLD